MVHNYVRPFSIILLLIVRSEGHGKRFHLRWFIVFNVIYKQYSIMLIKLIILNIVSLYALCNRITIQTRLAGDDLQVALPLFVQFFDFFLLSLALNNNQFIVSFTPLVDILQLVPSSSLCLSVPFSLPLSFIVLSLSLFLARTFTHSVTLPHRFLLSFSRIPPRVLSYCVLAAFDGLRNNSQRKPIRTQNRRSIEFMGTVCHDPEKRKINSRLKNGSRLNYLKGTGNMQHKNAFIYIY